MSSGKFDDRYARQLDRKRLEEQATRKSDEDEEPLPETPVEQATTNRVAGRNDPCPCGSGKKYKKCCGQNA